MTKNHLKRLAAPKSWNIKRKANVYVTRPRPGAHSMQESIPFTSFCKDLSNIAQTTKQVKYILNEKRVTKWR